MTVILLCLSLIGCGSSEIVKTQFIKSTVPPLPDKPTYYDIQWNNSGGYCLDEQGAKNLLKNKALTDDYIRQLENTIEGLR